MLLHWVLVGISLIVLYFGAEALVRGSASLALRLGLSPLVIGLTVVAFGTSSPEIFVSLKAAFNGHGDLAVGNVVGSNIFNVGVILGLSAVIMPMRVQLQLLRLDAPVMVLAMLAVPLLLLGRGEVSRWEGAVLIAALAAYVAMNIVLARRSRDPAIEREFEEGLPKPASSALLAIAMVVAGLALLAFGARLLTDSAIALARGFGVSEAVIGLTIVAAGTSIPELAASIVAALRREPDIAIGNVIGSNTFNVLAILGIAAVACPFHAPGIRPFDIWFMIGICAGLVPLLWTGLRLQRLEGALLFSAYCVYIALLWPKG
ncbi:MAG: calcium/sodium antiporter [Terrimicrobiaceae bacterium]|nr:calcium/sodium antiporter [Terrimicrobiaceae bacterium]